MTILVPHDRLQPQTLQALIEEFVTRDGAVHGHTDALVTNQIAAVRDQLLSGRVVIVFDDEAETCTICSADGWNKSQVNAKDEVATDRDQEASPWRDEE
jgi:uncharacterized protein YheU (UPF0270 family)